MTSRWLTRRFITTPRTQSSRTSRAAPSRAIAVRIPRPPSPNSRTTLGRYLPSKPSWTTRNSSRCSTPASSVTTGRIDPSTVAKATVPRPAISASRRSTNSALRTRASRAKPWPWRMRTAPAIVTSTCAAIRISAVRSPLASSLISSPPVPASPTPRAAVAWN